MNRFLKACGGFAFAGLIAIAFIPIPIMNANATSIDKVFYNDETASAWLDHGLVAEAVATGDFKFVHRLMISKATDVGPPLVDSTAYLIWPDGDGTMTAIPIIDQMPPADRPPEVLIGMIGGFGYMTERIGVPDGILSYDTGSGADGPGEMTDRARGDTAPPLIGSANTATT